MIRYIRQQYLDTAKYDLCVQRHEPPIPYGERWYLNACCEQWDCLVLNDYDAVWPLPFREKLGVKYFFRPFGVQQLGVFTKKVLIPEQWTDFVQTLRTQAMYGDIFLNQGQTPSVNILANGKLSAQSNLMVDIKRPYQSVYEHYSQNLKRKLKKIEKEQFQLFEHDGPSVVLSLFAETKGKELGLSPEFFRVFKKVLFQALHRGQLKVLTVYGGPNMLLGGACFLEYRNRAVFLLSALSPEGREMGAMPYIINEYLIFNSEHMEWLDFEGANHEGLARFYAMFGAQDYPYYRLQFNRLPWPLCLLKS